MHKTRSIRGCRRLQWSSEPENQHSRQGRGRRPQCFTAVWLALLLSLSGCATKPGFPGQPVEDADNSLFEIRQMLRDRSQRLMRGDIEGYLRPLSPEARVIEEPIARGALSLPLASFEVLFRPAESASLNADSYQDVPTFVSYRFKGLSPDNIFRTQLLNDVERAGGGWKITRSVLKEREVLPAWFRGPIEVDDSPNFLILFRPGLEGVKEAAALAEEALSRVRPQLTLIPDKKHLLILARDHQQFEDIMGEPVPEGALGVTLTKYEGDGIPRQRSITVDISALFSDPSRSVSSHAGRLLPLTLFQHEIGHLLASRYTSPLTPGWVSEGAAMYLAEERRDSEWRLILQEGLLNDDLSHILLAGESVKGEASLAGALYPYANAAVLVLVEEFGKKRFWDFYRGYRVADSEGESQQAIPALTRDLLRKHFGLDERELDAKTRKLMSEQAAS